MIIRMFFSGPRLSVCGRNRTRKSLCCPGLGNKEKTLKHSYGMRSPPFQVFDQAVDALSLMAHSDAVVERRRHHDP